jgi:DNA-binding YbaB/EbfC family protein|tara:strand:+ start:194 stop:511 length:318 start_codon:yes stop_codon:yes gene_type:complete
MTDFSKILDKAKELENMMKDSQEKIKNIRVEGISGGNAVKVILNGDGEIVNLHISSEILEEDKSVVEDLIKAAHNNAKTQLKVKTSEEISKATGGLGVSGFKWPL